MLMPALPPLGIGTPVCTWKEACLRAVVASLGNEASLVVARVIKARGNVSGMHKCSISFKRHTGQYTDML